MAINSRAMTMADQVAVAKDFYDSCLKHMGQEGDDSVPWAEDRSEFTPSEDHRTTTLCLINSVIPGILEQLDMWCAADAEISPEMRAMLLLFWASCDTVSRVIATAPDYDDGQMYDPTPGDPLFEFIDDGDEFNNLGILYHIARLTAYGAPVPEVCHRIHEAGGKGQVQL